MLYNSIRDYAIKKGINRRTAKKMLEDGKIIKISIKGKKAIIDIKEMLKYLITEL